MKTLFAALLLLATAAHGQGWQPAIDAQRNHTPFPGLPDMTKPVYVKVDSMLCTTFQNQWSSTTNFNGDAGKRLLLAAGYCVKAPTDIRVMLLVPDWSDREWINEYTFKIIPAQFTVPGGPATPAQTYTVYVSLADLTNKVTR